MIIHYAIPCKRKAELLILTWLWFREFQSTFTTQKESKQRRRQLQVQIFELWEGVRTCGNWVNFFLQILLNKDTLFRLRVCQFVHETYLISFWLRSSNQLRNSEKLYVTNE